MANNLRTDSSYYKTELLSPAAGGDDLSMAMESERPLRLNIDKFHLPEGCKDSSYFSLGHFLRCLRTQRKISEYYKKQEKLLKGFNEVDTFNELGILQGSLTEEEMKQLAKSERVAIYASNVANLVLFLAKEYVYVESRSLAVMATTLDSLLYLLSGFILWFTSYATRKPNQYRYPIGKNRMQPIGIVVFASVMAILGLKILFESGRELIIKAQPERILKNKSGYWDTVSVTLVKLVLTVYCRRFENQIIKAYAQDHFFDVITNSALYTMGNWAKTVMDNVWVLIRRTVPAEYLPNLTYLIWNHHKEIRHIEAVRAYTFGSHYFAEVHIVLAETCPLPKHINIGQTLEDKIEQIPEIERAFVHMDFDVIHSLKHESKRS